MPLAIRTLDELGIVPVPLRVLIPDNQTARFQLYQSGGELYLNDCVRNKAHDEALAKHAAFLKSARSKNSLIALTPEYSCPWEVVEMLAADKNYQPNLGSVWVLGCESIQPEELLELKERTKQNISWYNEDVTPSANQVFLSAAVYIFHLQGSTDEDVKLCGLIQFKTHDMGGTTFERDRLIKGSIVYKITNPNSEIHPDSISLLTLICADTFNFKLNILEGFDPYLVVHLQLNSSPYDAAIVQYRNLIYSSPKREEVEIIALNWAEGTSLGANSIERHNGSMYFMQGGKLDKEPCQKNSTIDSNHKLGVHLRFSSELKYSAYVFSSDESVFSFETTKVCQRVPGAHGNRSGIQDAERLIWDVVKNKWEATDYIDDGINASYEKVTNNISDSYINREKLIALSLGNISEKLVKRLIPSEYSDRSKDDLKPEFWHKPKSLNSFYLGLNDRPKGTLALLDASQGTEISSSLASLSNILVYMAGADNLPKVFADFGAGQIDLCLNSEEVEANRISHNLSVDEKSWGTVVELGNMLEDDAQMKFDEIKAITKSSRLLVWYTNSGSLKKISDNEPEFTGVDHDPREFTG